MEIVEDDPLQFKLPGSHVFCRQHHSVDGSKSGVRDQDAGQIQLSDHIFQLQLAVIKIYGTHDAAGAFHRHIVVCPADFFESFFDHIHLHRISFQAGCQMRRYCRLINIGAHGFQRLSDPGNGLYM